MTSVSTFRAKVIQRLQYSSHLQTPSLKTSNCFSNHHQTNLHQLHHYQNVQRISEPFSRRRPRSVCQGSYRGTCLLFQSLTYCISVAPDEAELTKNCSPGYDWQRDWLPCLEVKRRARQSRRCRRNAKGQRQPRPFTAGLWKGRGGCREPGGM